MRGGWFAVAAVVGACVGCAGEKREAATAWPPITREARPWVYNWWMGSAVDEGNLQREMARYHEGGIGGIQIIPIYGAKGAEGRYVQYLSPRWTELMSCAVEYGRKLDMGVDMTMGTGWCFGGPGVTEAEGGQRVDVQVYDAAFGGKPASKPDAGGRGRGRGGSSTAPRVISIVAVGPGGERVDVPRDLAADGSPAWVAPAAGWKVAVMTVAPTRFKVKRAAPGGEGYMINPFDAGAMRDFLATFEKPLADARLKPRSLYQDSYEYQTSWSQDVVEEFARRRGYRIESKLADLAGLGDAEVAARVKGDYRRTVSEVMAEKVMPEWTAWCRERGYMSKYEAHGSPANLLDLYALADIPETEMFGHVGADPLVSKFEPNPDDVKRDPLLAKMASSAAHVAGRKLVAAETGTWMAEHFCESLEEMKSLVDRMFVSGINHVFYHGCCYSPDDAAWPGWVFYASTEMNPRNPFWHDVPALNEYVARCQSVLQSGVPDNDVLVYWPIDDQWHDEEGWAVGLNAEREATWLKGSEFGRMAGALWKGGYQFDYVSDAQLQRAGHVGTYKAIVVPPTKHLRPETAEALLGWAERGMTVIFEGGLPADVPGASDVAGGRERLSKLWGKIAREGSRKPWGKGTVVVGPTDVGETLRDAGATPAATGGAMVIRRRTDDGGRAYFIANPTGQELEVQVEPEGRPAAMLWMDAMTGRTGRAPAGAAVRLRPNESIVVRRGGTLPAGGAWDDERGGAEIAKVDGPWDLRFISGGPALPADRKGAKLGSWASGDAEAFSGTAVYSTELRAPAGVTEAVLDLGSVKSSCRVRLNGVEVGRLIMPPYQLRLAGLKEANKLEVEVTNLGANRLRDLDKRGVQWRKFNDINFVSITYKPFDAAKWPVMESGLVGPVVLRKAEARD